MSQKLPIEKVEVWEKRKTETAKAFSAFIAYRNLPAHKRSLRQAAIEQDGELRPGRLRQFQTWSSKHSWVLRVEAWDMEVDRQTRMALIDKVKEATERHVKISQVLQQKALKRLQEIQPIELSVRDVLSYLMQSTKLERLTLGEPDEITAVQAEIDVVDYTTLTTEELRRRLAERVLLTEKTKDE